MIGNDVIDLELTKTESNWKRKGFLEKIFTESEQQLIQASKNPEKMVWVLWSCKEAVYKIYNRETLIRAFIPLQLECDLESYNEQISVKVKCCDKYYFCKTELTENYIYTIAAVTKDCFQFIKEFDKGLKIVKKDGIPYIFGNENTISITHHGKFDRRILLDS